VTKPDLTRRAALAGGFGLLGTPALAAAPRFKPEPDDMALGDPRARVTVVEYASVGCPHCAHWHKEVFAAFKAKYIDTHRVRFVVRECLTGNPDIAGAGFLLARCAGPGKYFSVIDQVYRRQEEVFASGTVLREIAVGAGMTDAAYTACMSNQQALDAVQARADRHVNVDKVNSTPTFEINGQRFESFMSLADLDTAIAAASRRGR